MKTLRSFSLYYPESNYRDGFNQSDDSSNIHQHKAQLRLATRYYKSSFKIITQSLNKIAAQLISWFRSSNKVKEVEEDWELAPETFVFFSIR